MTRVAYFDCFAGISGDMVLGALLDAGLPLSDLRRELKKIPLAGWELEARSVRRAGLAATQAIVTVEPRPVGARTLPDVLAIIEGGQLPRGDRERGAAAFRRLAEAEAKVHGESVETVALHDVGSVDAVVDVMGSILGLRLLGVDEVYASPLPLTGGEVEVEGGSLPLPAPATLALLAVAGAPLVAGADGELVTPTGAAIVASLARFQRPAMTVERVGYGAGSRDPQDRPNVLRLWLGQALEGAERAMVLIETNIDDMTGEMLGYVQGKLLQAGAADVWFTAIQMKKGRPGVLLSVLCSPATEEAVAHLLLKETSTLGVRVRPVHRYEAEREVREFESSLGPAAVKVKRLPGEPPRVAPEYEACKRLAERSGLPLAEVYRIVQAEAEALLLGET
ncbi:MAG: nickel pincer cofactor biosynthesis protein LarC [Dehalococcoidia bacterium]